MPRRITGFRFAGVATGVKTEGLDLGLIASDRPASAAAVFTQSRAAAAPVQLSRAALRHSGGLARAIVVNSGNANACTGPRGQEDARQMIGAAAEALGVDEGEVLLASTGVIGVPLPMDAVIPGISRAAEDLRAGDFGRFSEAILTTDRGPKEASRSLELDGRRIHLLGCTKGAGMIAPNMATTLTFVVSNAAIGPRTLDGVLRTAVAPTYNAITIDGDTSTNDMVAILANGAAGGPALRGRHLRSFEEALTDLLDELSRALMRGGEGVHHVVDVEVVGASSDRAARTIARTVATSPLVKTAIAGRDPNWGRILAAAGHAGVPFSPGKATLHIGDVCVIERGTPLPAERWEQPARQVMKLPSYTVRLDVGAGRAAARILTCDLSREYVELNADYRS